LHTLASSQCSNRMDTI